MLRVADKNSARIVYLQERASPEYWSRLWESKGDWLNQKATKSGVYGRAHRLIAKHTPTSGVVLEGGCGMGQIVASLADAGYQVVGIDSAKDTVTKLNQFRPDLDIRSEELTSLNSVESTSVDTYYSGGVIEHFEHGYAPVIQEAHRVLKPRGILIVTFPFMSWSRRREVKKLRSVTDYDFESFYQYALEVPSVKADISTLGFTYRSAKARNGLKGAIESCDSSILRAIYSPKSPNFFKRAVRLALGSILAGCGFGHTIELVFEKNP